MRSRLRRPIIAVCRCKSALCGPRSQPTSQELISYGGEGFESVMSAQSVRGCRFLMD